MARWMAIACIGLLGVYQLGYAQEVDEKDREVKEWVEQLTDPSYSTRQIAYWRLIRNGSGSVPFIEESLRHADADATERMIRILNEMAVDPNSGPGPEALAALRRASKSSITLYGMLAKRAIESLAEQQRTVVLTELRQLGVYIGQKDLQVLTERRPSAYHVRIAEEYLGTEADLDRLQWMVGVEILVLEGTGVTAGWLERVARMPSLKTLQIRRANLKDEDLKVLKSLDKLDILEFVYVPIGDDAVKFIEGLPLGTALRMFGTNVTAARFLELKDTLGDIETYFGRGGYLGVSIDQRAGVVISNLPEGSAARSAGMIAGDRIVQINDAVLTKFEDLRKELAKYAPNETIKVVFERPTNDPQRPAKFKVDVVLGMQP